MLIYYKNIFRTVILFLCFANLSPVNCQEAFSSLSLGINILKNKPDKDFNNYWNSDLGIEGRFETPFYFGDLQAGGILLPFKSKNINQPDFNSYFIFMGWGKKVNLPLKLFFFSTIKAGSFVMNFNLDSLGSTQKIESELGLGFKAGLGTHLFSPVQAFAGVEALQVFTRHKISFILFSAGLTYSFATPVWLKDFLE
ncbi:MAG: hypothetical protein C4539_18790 [Ignavibacteriales bacterium]|nr:MAG: hypothetical protein C4539_18790 [Ignavibacteriales bacterium]